MDRCASVRKKGSLDQCPVRPVFGHTLCGRHAKAKQPVLWVDVHRNRHSGLVKAQALVRGYLLRTQLALGGPGVLRRANLSNDEDLHTMNSKSEVSPFEYFGFEENGKIWWFEFPTLFTWVLRSETPVNPYTKVPLSTDTRKRLFHMWTHRIRHRRPPVLSLCPLDEPRGIATYLAQVFTDNGFADIGAGSFLEIPKSAWARFFRLLQNDLMVMYAETSRLRRRGMILCRRMEVLLPTGTPPQYCAIAMQNLLRLLTIPNDPYLLCFTALSCFYRS